MYRRSLASTNRSAVLARLQRYIFHQRSHSASWIRLPLRASRVLLTARTIATINAFQPAAETRGGASSALAPLRYRGHPLALGGGSSSPIVNRSRPPPGHAPPAGPSIAMAAALPHFPRVSECLGRSIAAASPSGSRSFLRRLAPQPRRAIVSAGAHACALLAACGRLCAAGRGALPPSVGASALPLARR